MIKIENITKKYGEYEALKGLSLEIQEGECLVLIGPSGCGKSSLLKCVNRLVEPDQGHIYVDGVDTQSLDLTQLRRQMGYCIQNVGLFPHYTVGQNISIVLDLLKRSAQEIDVRIRELMDLVHLSSSLKDKYPHQLSGGEAQRVGVCRALAADPKILLMDEPFRAVDPLNRERIQLEFQKLQKSLHKTVLFVTHDLEEAILLGDRIALMSEGKILELSTPKALANSKNQEVLNFIGKDYFVKVLNHDSLDVLNLEKTDDTQDAYVIEENLSLKAVLALLLRQPKVIYQTSDARFRVSIQDIVNYLKVEQ
jgi:osmoprotectant transport system ATP-binding protein